MENNTQINFQVTNLMDYPDFDVRSASIEATGYFLMACFKSGDAAVAEKFSDGLTMFLDTLVGIVKEEEEHQVKYSVFTRES